MTIYTLDDQLRRSEMLEKYETLIWTERFSTTGDFELHIKSTPEIRGLLTLGTRLVIDESDRVMTIESREEETDEDDVVTLIFKGRSIEYLMEDRGAVYSFDPSQAGVKYYLSGAPGICARNLFYAHAYSGQADPKDVFPYIQVSHRTAELSSASFQREPTEVITWLVEPEGLYTAIKKLCDVYELGFKIVRPTDAPELYFYVYPGFNRTSSQNSLDPLIFSPDLDNVENTKELKSDQLLKNVAYMTSSALNRIIYAPGVDPNVSGFQRRVIVVDLGDVGDPPNAGPYPEMDPEPDYGEPVVYPEPDYGIFVGPMEPDYGAPPEGMEGYALWVENRDAMRAQWESDYAVAQQNWQTNYYATRDAWLANNANAYNDWYNSKQFIRNDWINAHNNEVYYWNQENERLRNVWLAELSEDMNQKAAEAFSDHKVVSEFDGEINEHSPLRYGIDYELGDLVELQNDDGDTFIRRITEQIFVNDSNGKRAYPTLSETKRTI